MSVPKSKNIVERLDNGELIVGDGSYVFTLERRGYVKCGHMTPEASVEYPEAVEALAVEYARAGADITQTFTFYSRDIGTPEDVNLTCEQINQASCDIAKKVSKKYGTIVAGGIVYTAAFKQSRNKKDVQDELREGLEVLIKNDVDLIIVEYFRNIIEMEWALELALSYGKQVASTMCIGPQGDQDGVSAGECAVRMVKAGAKIVGANCLFDPFITLETMKVMKAGLKDASLTAHLMCQPLGYRTPDGGSYGWIELPEYPYAVEPRTVTRFEAAKYARQAYDLGVRFIGGCCGIESVHIRAIAEELAEEHKYLPEASRKSDLDLSVIGRKANLGRKEYLEKKPRIFGGT